jgi:hypothetical protein
MTNKELIDEILALYASARKPSEKYGNPNIFRGRLPSISSQTEDLMANFILGRVALREPKLLVDFPMSYEKKGKSKNGNRNKTKRTFYPDIAVIQKNHAGESILTDIIDVKLDLGWLRVLDTFLPGTLEVLEDLRKKGKVQHRDRNENDYWQQLGSNVIVSPDLCWHVAVISDSNSSEKWRTLNQAIINEDRFKEKVQLYMFTGGHHPNSGGIPTIYNDQIDRFVSAIKPL